MADVRPEDEQPAQLANGSESAEPEANLPAVSPPETPNEQSSSVPGLSAMIMRMVGSVGNPLVSWLCGNNHSHRVRQTESPKVLEGRPIARVAAPFSQ